MSEDKFQFAIDRGGTFTDVYARCPGGKVRVMKLLSVDPLNYSDAPREGIRRILEQVGICLDTKLNNKIKLATNLNFLAIFLNFFYEISAENNF